MTIDREDGEQTAAEVKLSERLYLAAKIHSEIGGQTAMADTIREAAELARSVEDAPVGWVSGADMESAMQTVVMDKWPGSVRCGHDARVRIVPEQGEGEG